MRKKDGSISNKQYQPKHKRVFSVTLKKKLVEDIESKRLTVRDVVTLYKVSDTSVYLWLKKYSTTQIPGVKMVVESESASIKVIKLQKYIEELERKIGKQQIKIEALEKVIDLCNDEVGYDIKKKLPPNIKLV